MSIDVTDRFQNYTVRWRQTLKKIPTYKLLIDFFYFQLYVISDYYELGSCNFLALSTAAQYTTSFLENADMSQNYTARGHKTLKKIQIFKLSRSKSQKTFKGDVAPRGSRCRPRKCLVSF